MNIKQTTYDEARRLVVTELSGELDENEVEVWRHSLDAVLNSLETGTRFKILVNLHGFKARNFDAHKKFRVVIPQTLAAYGWYVGYLRMFPEATLTLQSQRGVYCVAAAHVHQDESKIQNYATHYSMKNEGFFTDPAKARQWLEAIPFT